MSRYQRLIAAGVLLSALQAAEAQSYVSVSGQVSQIMIVAGAGGAPGNYDFRVLLQGNPVQCNGQTWSYVNVSDPNYKGIVAGILSARAANQTVNLNLIQDGAGYCQIGYIVY